MPTFPYLAAGTLAVLLLAMPVFAQPAMTPTDNAMPSGPLLSDRELFDAFDLNSPGLETVRADAARGDWEAAKADLARYFKARTAPSLSGPRRDNRGSSFDLKRAEDALAGRVRVVTLPHTFLGGDIDWSFNLTKARDDLPDNNEWQWQLNRMGFWGDLGRAYAATGDEKWALGWVHQMTDWARTCPPPGKQSNGAGSSWRTIETGIRLGGSWPVAFEAFLASPSFGSQEMAVFLKATLEQARYLRQFPTTGNWLTMEMSGLYTTGALFPEWKQAREWRAYAVSRLHQELGSQFLPDGAQVELTPGYHNVALGNVLKIPEIAQRTGLASELPTDYIALTERAFDFNLFLMTPDRSLPRFNDSWPSNVPRTLQGARHLFPTRADFAWAATDGKEGTPPDHASHPFRYAGYFVMRGSWQRDANYAVLDAGPLGYSHVHQDKLNLVVWAYGRDLLFDSGGGSYETSAYRRFATDTFGHNTVLVDHLPQRRQTQNREANVSRTPLDARWQSTASHDFVQGIYDEGYGDEANHLTTHTRRVLFLKPDAWLVSDILAPRDDQEHEYQARWHLLSTQTRRDEATGGLVTTDEGQPNLAIVPLWRAGLDIRAASAQTEPELLGWNIRKDEDPQYLPATTLLHTRRGQGVQRFLTLLLPLQEGSRLAVRQVTPRPNGATVVLSDGRQWDIEAGIGAQDGITLSEQLPDGKPGRSAQGG